MRGNLERILAILQIVSIASPVICQNFCLTPGRKMGRCVSIYDCDYLLNILKSTPLTQQSVMFLKSSQCDPGDFSSESDDPHVCCARNDDSLHLRPVETSATLFSPNFEVPLEEETSAEKILSRSGKDLPSRGECGREAIEFRIYSGQDTARGEFPWLALLQYRKISGELSINCGGSLINHKYVLSAAHCLSGDITSRIGPLVNVRLGDYDLRQDLACNGRFCGNPNSINEIAEIIPHEKFNNRAINRRHDIGLIRLKKAVEYTASVHPICLPTSDLPPLETGETTYITGFGRTLVSKISPIKQKLRLPVFDHQECKRKFASKRVEIKNDQICAGGEFSKDACDGNDSGGPLMRFHNSWIVEGIVSFGYLCGMEGWPAIYTKVSSYTDWIEDNLKP